MTRPRIAVCGLAMAVAAAGLVRGREAAAAGGDPRAGPARRADPKRQLGRPPSPPRRRGSRAPDGVRVRVEERDSRLTYVLEFDDDPVALVGATGANGTIIPLYTRPTDSSWGAVVVAKRAHPSVPTIVIINPANGPGDAAQAAYVAGTARLNAAGVKVIGYVATLYGRRAASLVESQIDQYRAWYPAVTGVFFDEMATTPEFESYYRALGEYAKSRGHDLTVANPGTDLPPSYLGSADIFVVRESEGLPKPLALGGVRRASREKLAAISYGVSTVDPGFVRAVRPYVGYIYLQSDGLPNPWDSVPSYLSELLAILE
jgi:hypothetical protein